MNMFAQTKTILTPTYLRERMAPPAPVKLDLRHGVILYLEDINVSFDGFKALNNLNLYINKGELRCIIGPNGAGKSTMMDVITGKTRPDTGSAWFGQNINLLELDEPAIAEAGIGRKFQKPTVFEPLTVEENLELAMVRIPVNLNSDSGICEHHFRKVCGQGFCEQKLSFEGRHLFDSPNKPAAKRSAAVVDPGHWSMTVHLTSEFVL
ncbi:ATP-binding cassette domain-containing protein [Aeromonas caviae]|uniref:ATP-binding cassette domain-containing protein n=1 Tax=Aeromonas caviae TaxID=648 RepID=UPI001CC5D039|nr:ATP-binding cassette domain-containing protein [Aeromonas caviae]GJA33927.1 hypothetical protein KAM341_36050 [Aeromonas caviae]